MCVVGGVWFRLLGLLAKSGPSRSGERRAESGGVSISSSDIVAEGDHWQMQL